jgi:hypothetical protein
LGSFPDAREGCVDFEHVREVLGALRSEVVAVDADNNSNLALGGADTKHASMMHAAHLSVLVAVFELTRLAITTAEATPRFLCER